MEILFAEMACGAGKEIYEILQRSGIGEKTEFPVITEHERPEIGSNPAITVFAGNSEAFRGIALPGGTVGICEDSNLTALKILMENGATVITCGMNPKNTVTLSSLTSSSALVSLQRTVTDIFGNDAEPCEIGIKLNRGHSPFAVTASAAVLLLAGVTPAEF